jgi:hypothetical protein
MPVSLGSITSSNLSGAIVPIATIRGTHGTEDLAINNIPQIYQDLMLVVNATVVSIVGNPSMAFQLNTNNSGYSNTMLNGNGTTLSSSRSSGSSAITPNLETERQNATYPTSLVIHFLNYKNSIHNKTALTRGGIDRNGSGNTAITASTLLSTSPITTIRISSFWAGTYWTVGSTFTLYGIRAGT